MPLFVVEYTYSAETVAGRDEHRPAHREWLGGLAERKTVVSSGPFADGSGAFIVVDAADATTVELLFTHDPFARNDLIAATRIVEWIPVVGEFSS
ncbi:YciI family protein [Rhodococcus marinonascens]|uniref:YciI family protein n=1 Tax=Rhodococcus marinonascens TaxID=38311 RepID=UPI0009338322|nr:YciI family protein [Rhodococcus marinonascens]